MAVRAEEIERRLGICARASSAFIGAIGRDRMDAQQVAEAEGCLGGGACPIRIRLNCVSSSFWKLRGQAGERQVEGEPRVGYAQVYGAPGTAAATILLRADMSISPPTSSTDDLGSIFAQATAYADPERWHTTATRASRQSHRSCGCASTSTPSSGPSPRKNERTDPGARSEGEPSHVGPRHR